jgi:hypothetical protein
LIRRKTRILVLVFELAAQLRAQETMSSRSFSILEDPIK